MIKIKHIAGILLFSIISFALLSSLMVSASSEESAAKETMHKGYWSPHSKGFEKKIEAERFILNTKKEHAQVVSLVAEQIVALSTEQAKEEIAEEERRIEAERVAIAEGKERRRIAREKAEAKEKKEKEEREKAEQALIAAQKEKQSQNKRVAASTSSPGTASYIASGTGEYPTAVATHYTAYCNGCSGITKTGINARASIYHQGKRVIAVDPEMIRLGSIVEVVTPYESFLAIAGDIGGDIKGRRIDILVATKEEAYRLGRYQVKYRVVN